MSVTTEDTPTVTMPALHPGLFIETPFHDLSTGRGRLAHLADFLDTVKLREFDLRTWKREADCGTTACAVGWAATLPEFQELGFYIQKLNMYQGDDMGGSFRPIYTFGGTRAIHGDSHWSAQPSGSAVTQWEAVDAFFEIPSEVSGYLFLAGSYDEDGEDDATVAPGEVAARIREYLAE
jgi:hypothetical protein